MADMIDKHDPTVDEIAATMLRTARDVGKEAWSRDSYDGSHLVYSGPNLVADPRDTLRPREYCDYLIAANPANVMRVLERLRELEAECESLCRMLYA